ncbi:ABC transporter permease [Halothermothrix orenii]|uniref:ABC-type transport system, involved in lipoprotein release, permease component n=1 Tax=Halothermothrix orenii (strain H 168 / OCM 544 / DSM 9562) TaxID=373903 RepID=B8D1B6_HALOH|nr:FtsX-like permease family protein [Halothermothrix orenii]ACL71068.1 ABC-type transport system, involved in lipoprotein release, permease component [Halothermothrix orenii H 168]
MKYLAKLAYKNLYRQKLRTAVSIAAIVFSVAVVVFARGLISGFIGSIYSDYIYYDSGHIRIVKQEYLKKERLLSLAYPVDGFEGEGISSMVARLEELEGINMALPRLKFGAVVSTDDELIKMMGWGVDPEKEKEFTDIDELLVEGRFPRRGMKEIVLGSELLAKLDKGVGEKVTVLYTTSFNSFQATTFKIVGRIESGLKLLNETVFMVPLDVAQKALYMPDQATELLLVTPDLNRAGEYLPGIRKVFERQGGLNNYAIRAWDDSSGMIRLMKMAENIYNVIYVFLVVLASFVVINSMIMIVKERTREIGMMSALGLGKRQILQLFVLEGGVMGVVGSFIGALLGGLITRVVAVTGIDYTKALEGMGEDILMRPVIYPVFSFDNMIFAFVLGVVVTSLACLIPARRAARLKPTEALREI